MKRRGISDEELAAAKKLRDTGMPWGSIVRLLGRRGESFRRRLDPEYRARRNESAKQSYRRRSNSPLCRSS